MVKQEFLAAIREPLKAEGYRKKGFYWYKTVNDLVFCLNLQGSQWDKDDYYFQVGVALHKDSSAFPTILHWLFRHRCTGKNGELNMHFDMPVHLATKYGGWANRKLIEDKV